VREDVCPLGEESIGFHIGKKKRDIAPQKNLGCGGVNGWVCAIKQKAGRRRRIGLLFSAEVLGVEDGGLELELGEGEQS